MSFLYKKQICSLILLFLQRNISKQNPYYVMRGIKFSHVCVSGWATAVVLLTVIILSIVMSGRGLVILDAASGEWRTVDRHFIRARNATPFAVATLVLNQGRYLREWIEFHSLMGVGLFVIFDDNSTDATASVVRKYVEAGTVHLVHAKASFDECVGHRSTSHFQGPCQTAVFNFALSQLRGKVVWCVCF